MDIKEAKQNLRNKIRQIESTLSPAEKEISDRIIIHKVLQSDLYQNAETIFSFVGCAHEIDTSSLLYDALRQGKKLLVPKCISKTEMVAVRIESVSELVPGMYGILEPSSTDKAYPADKIDLVIVPCVSCDRSGNRLGMGGGYYDRFLSGYRKNSVMLCRKALLCDHIPHTDLDVKILPVITD